MERHSVPRPMQEPHSSFWRGVELACFFLLVAAALAVPMLFNRADPVVEAARAEAREMRKANAELVKILAHERSRVIACQEELLRRRGASR